MKRNWFIPECSLDTGGHPLPIRFISDKSEGNLCISGFYKSGKSFSLLRIVKEIEKFQSEATILILVFRNIDVNKFKITSRELGLNLNVLTYWQFHKNPTCYDYILCDEIQLISQTILLEIKEKANHVVVTINPNLRLFEYDPLTNTQPLTLEVVRETLLPEEYELRDIQKSFGSSTIELARQLLNNDLSTTYVNMTSMRQNVCICEATSKEEELQYISKKSARCLNCGYSVAILLPTNRDILTLIQALIRDEGKEPWIEVLNNWGKIDYNNLNRYLSSIGLNIQCLGSNYGQLSDITTKINIMSYHSSMGFEFDDVYLPYVNSGLFISSNSEIEINAFILAMTRATHHLYITYSGTMHPYLELIKDKCELIKVRRELIKDRCLRIKNNNETDDNNILTL